jgi:hypothetical protein
VAGRGRGPPAKTRCREAEAAAPVARAWPVMRDAPMSVGISTRATGPWAMDEGRRPMACVWRLARCRAGIRHIDDWRGEGVRVNVPARYVLNTL